MSREQNQGLGLGEESSDKDDEYDAYRKRMMLAYRFRPNPLVIFIILSIFVSYVNFFNYRIIQGVLITDLYITFCVL